MNRFRAAADAFGFAEMAAADFNRGGLAAATGSTGGLDGAGGGDHGGTHHDQSKKDIFHDLEDWND